MQKPPPIRLASERPIRSVVLSQKAMQLLLAHRREKTLPPEQGKVTDLGRSHKNNLPLRGKDVSADKINKPLCNSKIN